MFQTNDNTTINVNRAKVHVRHVCVCVCMITVVFVRHVEMGALQRSKIVVHQVIVTIVIMTLIDNNYAIVFTPIVY